MRQWTMIVVTALVPSTCFLAFVIFATTMGRSDYPPRHTAKPVSVEWFKTKYPERVLLEGVADVR